MANPFLAPDADTSRPGPPADPDAEVVRLVSGMRFPQLLLGGLYGLGSLALLGFGGIAFLGSLGGPMSSDEQTLIRVIGAMYAVMGGLALLPSGLLLRSGLAALMSSHEPEQAIVSLRAQLWFWRVLALYVIGTTALYALGFFLFVGVGIFAGL